MIYIIQYYVHHTTIYRTTRVKCMSYSSKLLYDIYLNLVVLVDWAGCALNQYTDSE